MDDLPPGGGQPRETGANTAYAAAFGLRESACARGGVRGRLAGWWGKGPPRRRSVAGLRGHTATLALRHGPDSCGRQQWGILDNGGNPDPATPRDRGRPSGRKGLSAGTMVKVPAEAGAANYVPAAAVIRRLQALFGITGRKASAGGAPCRS